MDPSRKRRVRLLVASTAALLLAGALAYTSFSAGSDEKTAAQLLAGAQPGQTYTLAGTVAPGSIRRAEGSVWFRILDPSRDVSARVRYTGIVPDPFREGRGVMVKVRVGPEGLGNSHDTLFLGKKDTMVTKCPSKFQVAPEELPKRAPEDLLRSAPAT